MLYTRKVLLENYLISRIVSVPSGCPFAVIASFAGFSVRVCKNVRSGLVHFPVGILQLRCA